MAESPDSKTSFTAVLFQLKDYKDFTYTEMVSTTAFHLEAIQRNKEFKQALRALVKSEDIPAIKGIMEFCRKSGGMLGHRKDKLTLSADAVLSTLSLDSIHDKVIELQALQLFAESVTSFPLKTIHQMISLSHSQRQRLLRQFQSTPLDTSIHTFADKGAWSDPLLQPILMEAGYKLANARLQINRNTTGKDAVRAATMATLAIDIILTDFNED